MQQCHILESQHVQPGRVSHLVYLHRLQSIGSRPSLWPARLLPIFDIGSCLKSVQHKLFSKNQSAKSLPELALGDSDRFMIALEGDAAALTNGTGSQALSGPLQSRVVYRPSRKISFQKMRAHIKAATTASRTLPASPGTVAANSTYCIASISSAICLPSS